MLPSAATAPRRVHLAPFWDDLHTRSSGRVHALRTGDGGYVIQWSHVSKETGSSNSNEYDLNFQVVLFPNGAFEFRYGTMDPSPNGGSSCYPTSDCVGDANGASATIGYQDPSGARGHLLHIGGAGQTSSNRPFPGGLAGRSFRVDPTVTAGSWTFTADASKRMEVCAVASGFAACEPVHVEVLGAGTAILTEVMIAPSGGGAQWFEVRNTSLATLDLQGFEITTNTGSHTIADPVVVPPGGFAVFSRGATAGLQADYAYDASVAMDPSGDTLAIQSGTLTVTQASWDGSLPLPPGQSLELDALAHSRHAHTLDAQSAFCLPVTSYDGGANLGTPGWMGGTCMPGVTSDYTVDTLHHGTVFDIQSTGTTLLTGIGETTQVDLGFAFPYFGEDVTRLWVMSGAFVTVRSSTNAYTNQRLPHSGSQASAGIISPFWDDFYFSTHGASVKWEERSVGGQQVAIFEWHRARPWDASTSNHRLTIQLQLWQDGRIVFAYRDLAGFHGDVFGGNSTIGIQEPTSSDPRYMLYSYNRASISEGQMIEFTPAP